MFIPLKMVLIGIDPYPYGPCFFIIGKGIGSRFPASVSTSAQGKENRVPVEIIEICWQRCADSYVRYESGKGWLKFCVSGER
jgi:hypothetical protein